MRLVLHPRAENDIIEAAQWYSTRDARLGSEFLEVVTAATQSILSDPWRLPVASKNTRRLTLSRFPFSIYYRIADESVRIIAVAHTSRSPDFWLDRN